MIGIDLRLSVFYCLSTDQFGQISFKPLQLDLYVHVERGGVGHLRLDALAREADVGDGEHGGDAEGTPRRRVRAHDPEAHPRAHHQQHQSRVDLNTRALLTPIAYV